MCCDRCGRQLAEESDRIEVQGTHEHRIRNRSGVEYDVGLYGLTPGAVLEGLPEKEGSWFEGTAWQVLVCPGCDQQVGWSYLWMDPALKPSRFSALWLDSVLRDDR